MPASDVRHVFSDNDSNLDTILYNLPPLIATALQEQLHANYAYIDVLYKATTIELITHLRNGQQLIITIEYTNASDTR